MLFFDRKPGLEPGFHPFQVDVRESVAYKFELVCTTNYQSTLKYY